MPPISRNARLPGTDSGVKVDNSLRKIAAKWFARTHSGEMDAAERRERDAWLAEHPAHAYEFHVLESIWQAAAEVPAERLQALAQEPVRRRPSVIGRRAMLALAVCVLGVGVGWLYAPTSLGNLGQEYRTAVGERRAVELSDGSRIELNSGTQVTVRFDESSRQIDLMAGEALFSVIKNADRPFIVDAGVGTATVVGTQFGVRRDTEAMQVVVESGAVRVAGKHDASDMSVLVTPGQGVRVDQRGKVELSKNVPVASLLAWRKGQIVFSDTDLATAVREVSRYRKQPVVLANDKVGNLRLTGIFHTDDPDIFLKALPHVLPVAVRTLTDGRAEVSMR